MKDILFVFDHLGGREPGNCVAFGVSVFEGFFELCIKSSKVLRERVVEAEAKASCRKVDAHMAADPLFIYKRAKAMCFSLVL